MRRIAKVDRNQAEIVSALRAAGASVQTLHAVGGGVPDLLVGYEGNNLLLEVKDSLRPPSERKLTPDEDEWHAKWRGQVATVKSIHEALDVLESEVEENARLKHEIRNLQQILVAAGDLYPEIARLLKGDK